MKGEEDTYRMSYECNNCGLRGAIDFRKGERADADKKPCPNCCCYRTMVLSRFEPFSTSSLRGFINMFHLKPGNEIEQDLERLEMMERAVELLAEFRSLEILLAQGDMADTNAACQRITEIQHEFDRLITELEVEVKRG